MIARCRRLERVRTRQHDQARAASIRADATVAAATRALGEAEHEYLAAASAGPTVAALEQAMRCIDASVGQVAATQRAAAVATDRAQASARAWQRADVALARARAVQHEKTRRDEAREHDEHAARRKP